MFPQDLSLYSTRTQNTWRQGLASGVTPKYTNMLVYFGVTPDARPKICVTPDANPRRQSVEYRWRWVFWRWPCTFHVHFMYISRCLCTFFRVGNAKISQRKGRFQWNTGFNLSKTLKVTNFYNKEIQRNSTAQKRGSTDR